MQQPTTVLLDFLAQINDASHALRINRSVENVAQTCGTIRITVELVTVLVLRAVNVNKEAAPEYKTAAQQENPTRVVRNVSISSQTLIIVELAVNLVLSGNVAFRVNAPALFNLNDATRHAFPLKEIENTVEPAEILALQGCTVCAHSVCKRVPQQSQPRVLALVQICTTTTNTVEPADVPALWIRSVCKGNVDVGQVIRSAKVDVST